VIDVHATAAGDCDANLIGIGVEEPFQKLLPTRVFVQFIKKRYRDGVGQPVKPESINNIRRTCKNEFPIINVVTVDAGICVFPAS